MKIVAPDHIERLRPVDGTRQTPERLTLALLGEDLRMLLNETATRLPDRLLDLASRIGLGQPSAQDA